MAKPLLVSVVNVDCSTAVGVPDVVPEVAKVVVIVWFISKRRGNLFPFTRWFAHGAKTEAGGFHRLRLGEYTAVVHYDPA
jgi:hypothetical protein